jgi:hypothetical protein
VGRYGSRFTHQGSIRGAASYPPTGPGNCRPWMARWWHNACSRAKAEPPDGGLGRWTGAGGSGTKIPMLQVRLGSSKVRSESGTIREALGGSVRGPGTGLPVTTLGLGALAGGESRGYREPGCRTCTRWTALAPDESDVQPILSNLHASVMETSARTRLPSLPEGAGGSTQDAQPALGHPRPRQGGSVLAGAAGQVPKKGSISQHEQDGPQAQQAAKLVKGTGDPPGARQGAAIHSLVQGGRDWRLTGHHA